MIGEFSINLDAALDSPIKSANDDKKRWTLIKRSAKTAAPGKICRVVLAALQFSPLHILVNTAIFSALQIQVPPNPLWLTGNFFPIWHGNCCLWDVGKVPA